MIEILFARKSDVDALQAGAVQSVVSDTNVTGTIVGSVLTLGWAGTLAPARGGTGVNNGANTITLGGNISTASTLTTAGAVTFSGAFATTLTVSGTTVSTLPAGTHTLAAIDLAQTWTATQNIPTVAGGSATNATLTLEGSSNGAPSNDIVNVLGQTINLRATANSGTTSVNIGNANATGGILTIAGGTSGAQTYQPASVASGIITFPAGTVNFSATGGANQVVKQTSAGGIFTVGQVIFGEIGNQIQIGQFPTGPGIISNATLANMAAWTIKMNNTSGSAVPTDTTINALTTKATPTGADLIPIWDVAGASMAKATATSIVGTGAVASIDAQTGTFTTGNGIDSSGKVIELTAARRTLPTTQPFTSGSGATYTTPANALWLEVWIVGAGGGGGGSGTAGAGAGGAGNTSTFNSINALGGTGGGAAPTGNANGTVGGAGGSGGTGAATRRAAGGAGTSGVGGVSGVYNGSGGNGGEAPGFGGGGKGGGNATVGITPAGGFGGGGGGAGGAASGAGGAGGGGGGEVVYLIINTPAGSYTYTVGTGGTAGGAGTSGFAGGAGFAGYILVVEHYGS